ncbi:MAG: response regulator [Thermoguttaceae bacterium]
MPNTLLIVDDALIVREKIKQAALSIGWTVVGEACNGREAIERFAELRPSVVTLDMVMPECDGIVALQEILAIDSTAKVIIVSALGQKNILKDAFKLGASDFVIKPFDWRTLITTLEQFTTPETTAAAGVAPSAFVAEPGPAIAS